MLVVQLTLPVTLESRFILFLSSASTYQMYFRVHVCSHGKVDNMSITFNPIIDGIKTNSTGIRVTKVGGVCKNRNKLWNVQVEPVRVNKMHF